MHLVRIEIGGHTDLSGRPAQNMALSESRAQSVMVYLIQQGVDADRLVAKGYGITDPIHDPDTTPAQKAENRRVTIKSIKTSIPD